MPTDPTGLAASKAEAKRNNDGDLVIASVWLVLYLGMLVGTLTEPFLARAMEFTALY
jgi:hypothetical protein